jgi:hypothetical protein
MSEGCFSKASAFLQGRFQTPALFSCVVEVTNKQRAGTSFQSGIKYCLSSLSIRFTLKAGSRVRQKHNCLGFVFIAAVVSTCFGRAWPSSGHKLT